jgi:hypothetical protein
VSAALAGRVVSAASAEPDVLVVLEASAEPDVLVVSEASAELAVPAELAASAEPDALVSQGALAVSVASAASEGPAVSAASVASAEPAVPGIAPVRAIGRGAAIISTTATSTLATSTLTTAGATAGAAITIIRGASEPASLQARGPRRRSVRAITRYRPDARRTRGAATAIIIATATTTNPNMRATR